MQFFLISVFGNLVVGQNSITLLRINFSLLSLPVCLILYCNEKYNFDNRWDLKA